MAQKEYLKMADVFKGRVFHYDNAKFLADADGYCGEFNERDFTLYAAHAINSHDELVAEVERLREMVCRMGMYLEMSGEYPERESDNPVRQWLYDAIEIMTKQKRG